MENNKPYRQKKIGDKIYRLFDSETPEEEFMWHRDEKTRVVTSLNANDWKIQMDNELPFSIQGKRFVIPKGTWHRVIKGTGYLEIMIEEYD